MRKASYNKEEREQLSDCTSCPRNCHADRFKGGTGYCGMDAGLNIASVCIHRGEEPVISGSNGICNIFFGGCNLRCIYCQNHQISQPCTTEIFESDPGDIMQRITDILSGGINAIGFVSPSHMVAQVKLIIRELASRGYNPVKVYNTNGYDKAETIRSLDGLIDVYLPDYKYVTPELSHEYSGVRNYPEIALRALKEMYYQKGSTLITGETGMAESGLLIRHLVLPGHVDESKKVLDSLAEELSTGVNISLMSQYHPVPGVNQHPFLNRPLYRAEYEEVAEHMHKLGFRNGWVQDMESCRNYMPDFDRSHPFEL